MLWPMGAQCVPKCPPELCDLWALPSFARTCSHTLWVLHWCSHCCSDRLSVMHWPLCSVSAACMWIFARPILMARTVTTFSATNLRRVNLPLEVNESAEVLVGVMPVFYYVTHKTIWIHIPAFQPRFSYIWDRTWFPMTDLSMENYSQGCFVMAAPFSFCSSKCSAVRRSLRVMEYEECSACVYTP